MSDVADQAEAIEAMERAYRIQAARQAAAGIETPGEGVMCRACGETIDPRRRAAAPGARLCVCCQAEREGASSRRAGLTREERAR